MSPRAKWTTSVDELVRLFGDAIRALIPIAERARMHWKAPDAYDDWDHICEAIYRSIVIRSIGFAEGIPASSLPVPDYDLRISSYEKNSFIGNSNSKDEMAFVCFETETSPFDVCLFTLLDRNLNVVGNRRVATANAKFNLSCRDRDGGALKLVDELTVSL
jgi:hypothetical protein